MPDTQMKRLIEMMGSQQISPRLDVYLPSLQIKKKHLNTLSKGDILPLNSRELKVEIADDSHVLAQGIYGIYQDRRSVLIEDLSMERVDRSDRKSYRIVKVHLGTIERDKYDRDKIVKLETDEKFDASLYMDDDKLLARAFLVQIDGEMALEIEEIVR